LTAAEWDADLARLMRPARAPLLQSRAWGEVQARAGWEPERVRLSSGLATVLVKGSGALRWAYVPRGPAPPAPGVIGELGDWAREKGLARLRVDPEAGVELAAALREQGYRPAREVQPAHTLIVPLAPEADLLASFKPKWRYNIRLAERRGVEVERGADAAELARQAAATASREGISLPAASYYRVLLDLLPGARTYVARVDGKAVAAILVAVHDGRGYYLFGGSSGEHKEAMPNHALHWRAMRDLTAEGCVDYDLWGVAPPGAGPEHARAGIGKFKEGFGGRRVEYVGTWELVVSAPRHAAGEVLDGARRFARGLKKRVNKS
jgi:lipid II:glycine glycyltransferase (peptidoglycan interpeptide bridge formation enzyme)